ncbi:hypothetical protein ACFLR6_00240 [Campylobacterota bacterium]
MQITPKLLFKSFLFIVLIPLLVVFVANGASGAGKADEVMNIALTVIVQDRYEEEAILLAKENGADSVTILHGKNLFGLALEENVSVLHFILSRQNAIKIMGALDERYDFSNPETNNGIAFTQALTSVVGEYTQELE